MAGSPRRDPAPRRRWRAEQIELFPDPVHVERLDPRTVAGGRTSIRALYRVTIGHGGAAHLVFQDRHGTYCEEHGRTCRAVAAVAQG